MGLSVLPMYVASCESKRYMIIVIPYREMYVKIVDVYRWLVVYYPPVVLIKLNMIIVTPGT